MTKKKGDVNARYNQELNEKLLAELDTPISRALLKDLRSAARLVTAEEARFLVSIYYEMQDDRIRADGRVRAVTGGTEDEEVETEEEVVREPKEKRPTQLMSFLADRTLGMEKVIATWLDNYSDEHPMGKWMREIPGIGPVIASGMLAYININHAPTAGHLWSYAGLVPQITWLGREKAAKLVQKIMGDSKEVDDATLVSVSMHTCRHVDNIRRGATKDGKITRASLTSFLAIPPWNAEFKKLCWKLGECFKKVPKITPNNFYGRIYRERKAYEVIKNDRLEYRQQAEHMLATRNFSKDTIAREFYEKGMLPPGHIDARAKRYAVKLFLSHLQQVWWEWETGTPAPRPFMIEHGGHVDYIAPPVEWRPERKAA